MAAFPILSTGAVAQYPLARGTNFIVDIVRFLDGSEQRSLTRARAQRRWVIQLSKVTEAELASIEQFFDTNQGNFGSFDFIDPFSGETVRNCRISDPKIITEYLAARNGSTIVSIVENQTADN
jgi:Conserved hypothetical protein 2217 (DUF2460)